MRAAGVDPAARRDSVRAATTAGDGQLEGAAGTTPLRTGPDEMITLSADGEQFARDARTVLEALAEPRKSKHGNHGTSR